MNVRRISRGPGFIAIAFCAVLATGAHAAGVLTSVSGKVHVTGPNGATTAAKSGESVGPGTSITTESGAQATIRFDDGGIVMLDQSTQIRVYDYRYDPSEPRSEKAVLGFETGAARIVTGRIAEVDPANYAVRTPKAALEARGADFRIASGSLYVSVARGGVTASNTGGTVRFGAGQTGFIDTVWTRPVAIPASQIPGAVAQSFTRLGSVNLAVAGGGAAGGAGAAIGAAARGDGVSGAAIAAGLAGIAAAAGGGGGSTTTHH